MTEEISSLTGGVQLGPVFATTHWSVVLAARCSDHRQAQAALERLCRAYWYPLYHFIRRQGHSTHDAQDLTQEFFARFLEKNWMAAVVPSRGRFRSFLLMLVKRFLSVEWHRATAEKRRCILLPLEMAETRYLSVSEESDTPDQAFERQWALTLLEEVLRVLREDYESNGQGKLFQTLKPCLIGSREIHPYAVLAQKLGMSEVGVKVAVHRMRERYRERLREEIANTVASPQDVEDEMGHLFRVLNRST